MNRSLLKFSLYGAAALLLTFPLILRPGSHCPGSSFDLWGALWNFWYLKTQLLSGHFNFKPDSIFYPLGINLWQTMGHFLVPLLAVPLQLVFPLAFTYNLLLWLFLAGNAWCLSVLLEYLLKDRSAALLASLSLIFNSYIWCHMAVGSIEVIWVGWVFLALLYLFKLQHSGDARTVLAAAGFYTLATLTGWMYGVMLGMFTLLFCGYLLCSAPDQARRVLPRIALLLGIWLALVAPAAWQLRQQYGSLFAPYAGTAWQQPGQISALKQLYDGHRPWSSLKPEDIQLWEAWKLNTSGVQLSSFISSAARRDPSQSPPGWFLIFSGLLGLGLWGKGGRLWALSLMFFGVLALGPYYYTKGYGTFIPLPLKFLYQYFPGSSALQRPERLIFMVDVALSVGLAYLIVWLRARVKIPWGVNLVVLAALLLDFYSFKPELRLVSVTVPEFYARVAREPGDFALLEAPLDPLPFSNRNALYGYYQSVHHKKTFNAMLIRPQMWLQFSGLLQTQPFIAALLHSGWAWEPQALTLGAIRSFQALGFKYLIVHTLLPWEGQDADPERRVGFNEGTLLQLQELWGAPVVYPGGLLVFQLDTLNPKVKLGAGQKLELPRHQSYPMNFIAAGQASCQTQLDLTPPRRMECRGVSAPGGSCTSISFYICALAQPFTLTVSYRDDRGRELSPRKIILPQEQSWTRVVVPLPAGAAGSRGTLVFRCGGVAGGRCLVREAQGFNACQVSAKSGIN